MRRFCIGAAVAAACIVAAAGMDAQADTGSRFHGKSSSPKVTLLSRSYRWIWDPFRVDGYLAYAHVSITNSHSYALTLQTYCRANDKLLRSLSRRYLIEPGKTLEWDTRKLVRERGEQVKAVVTCKFWVDGQVNLKGEIVNRAPLRMGLGGAGSTQLTFNMPNYPPEPKS